MKKNKSHYIYRIFKRGSMGMEYGNEYFFDPVDAVRTFDWKVDFHNKHIEWKNNVARKESKRYANFYHFGKDITKELNTDDDESHYEKAVGFFYENQYQVRICEFKLLMEKVWVK